MKVITGFQSAKSVLSRQTPTDLYASTLEAGVRVIIDDVRKRGDRALFDLTLKFDGIELDSLEINKDQVRDAYRKVDKELIEALKLAASQINSFHNAQKENIWHEISGKDTGQIIRSLKRVGVYVPGGTASYPSTVLMTVIPAKIAGVSEVIMVTPPGLDGTVPPVTLVAADIAGVDRIFRIGGAQAIAALAFGTESVPPVDKICGPGNIYVTLAKKLVYGAVDIDGLAGPSELLIIADDTASPEYCAADLLAQAEHDELASVILITTSKAFADLVNKEVAQQLAALSRRETIAKSLERGIIVVVSNVDEAIKLANLYAPEHLSLMIDKAGSYLDSINNAGCVIVGRNTTVVLGDYVAGPSHVLPTGGTARFSSPLNVSDFIKYINVIKDDESGLPKLYQAASIIARAEGLDAHARAVERRLKPD